MAELIKMQELKQTNSYTINWNSTIQFTIGSSNSHNQKVKQAAEGSARMKNENMLFSLAFVRFIKPEINFIDQPG